MARQAAGILAYHGYPRTTGDIEIWIHRSLENACRVVEALRNLGFDVPELTPGLFLETKRIVRMGLPQLLAEILTSASGVDLEHAMPSESRMN